MSGSFTYGFPHTMPNLNEMNGLRFGIAFAPILSGGLVLGPRLIEAGKYVMKAELSGWPIVGGLVLAMLFCGAEEARATSITFELITFGTSVDVPVPLHARQDILPAGVAVASGGFLFTPGPMNGSGFNDLHISNQFSGDSFNGTTVGITHDDLIMTKVGGGTFSLQSFDFAGFPLNKEVPFLVTGILGDSTIITQTFTPNGKVDGNAMPVVDDFQTFYLDNNWTNLKSVTWIHTGSGTDRGLFAVDNIVVNEPKTVPEPSTITLLGLGTFFLLGQGWLARKRLKTLGVRTHSRAHKMSKTPAH
ncbi:MAG: PEP-CTERM sorting domain-containing protein [Nitrospira sp.]|nr:PEP-CTERM sorting domain-containing protein [Nitrospira sp.]